MHGVTNIKQNIYTVYNLLVNEMKWLSKKVLLLLGGNNEHLTLNACKSRPVDHSCTAVSEFCTTAKLRSCYSS
jgi:hypothetical protein